MRARARAALLVAAALALAACPDERLPCALWDCDGACVDVRVDGAHCGACGRACAEGQVCSGGACARSCEAPLVECVAAGGAACVAVRTDPANCGACGLACPAGQVCADGTCAPACEAPLSACGAGEGAWCADLARDRLSCGACGNACAPGLACDGGACVATCEGEARCDGACVDLWTDARHCGACGTACAATERCEGAVCRDACALDGLTRCGEGCADLSSDAANCGACGAACGAGGLCVAGACEAPACAAGPHLAGPPDLVDAVQSRALLAADVDGDGLPDLLLSEDMGKRIRLHRGLAAGGFAPGEDAVAGTSALVPEAAVDLDGDGDLDLLVAGGGAVTVQVNDGTGSFSAGTSYPHGDAFDAVIADLDGDGRLDVATSGAYSLKVWLAAAAGAPPSTYVESVSALRTSDVDGDGWTDLVLGHYHGVAAVTVLRNQGNGTFAAPVTTDAGASADDLELADLDADGDPDAVFIGWRNLVPGGEVLGVLRNDGGTLVPAAAHALPAGTFRYDLLVTDLDADGAPEAVVGETFAYRVFRNQGDGTFAPAALAVSSGAQSVAALDADRDGRLDLVAASVPVPAIELRRQRADGGWEGPEVLPVAADRALLADLDGDGRDDLVTLVAAREYDGRPLGTLEVRLAGPGGLGPPATRSGFGWGVVAAGDLDGDGSIDLVVSRADGAPGVLRNRGDGVLEDELPVLGMTGVVWLGDVDGGGGLDLVSLAQWYPYGLRVARGHGNGTFAPPVETALDSISLRGFAVADVDGDGRADAVMLAGYGDHVVRVHPGRDDGTFGPAWERPVELGAGVHPVALGFTAGDVDRDGAAEVAALFSWSLSGGGGWGYAGAVAVLPGGPSGPGEPVIHAASANGVAVAVGGLSGGGRRDLVVVTDHSLGVLAARADGTLAPEVRWAVPGAWGAPTIGDLDGDLRGDVVVPERDAVVVFRGACPAP